MCSAVRCGAVWCSMWCGALWRAIVCGTVRCGVVRCSAVGLQYGVVRVGYSEFEWYGAVYCGTMDGAR